MLVASISTSATTRRLASSHKMLVPIVLVVLAVQGVQGLLSTSPLQTRGNLQCTVLRNGNYNDYARMDDDYNAPYGRGDDRMEGNQSVRSSRPSSSFRGPHMDVSTSNPRFRRTGGYEDYDSDYVAYDDTFSVAGNAVPGHRVIRSRSGGRPQRHFSDYEGGDGDYEGGRSRRYGSRGGRGRSFGPDMNDLSRAGHVGMPGSEWSSFSGAGGRTRRSTPRYSSRYYQPNYDGPRRSGRSLRYFQRRERDGYDEDMPHYLTDDTGVPIAPDDAGPYPRGRRSPSDLYESAARRGRGDWDRDYDRRRGREGFRPDDYDRDFRGRQDRRRRGSRSSSSMDGDSYREGDQYFRRNRYNERGAFRGPQEDAYRPRQGELDETNFDRFSARRQRESGPMSGPLPQDLFGVDTSYTSTRQSWNTGTNNDVMS